MSVQEDIKLHMRDNIPTISVRSDRYKVAEENPLFYSYRAERPNKIVAAMLDASGNSQNLSALHNELVRRQTGIYSIFDKVNFPDHLITDQKLKYFKLAKVEGDEAKYIPADEELLAASFAYPRLELKFRDNGLELVLRYVTFEQEDNKKRITGRFFQYKGISFGDTLGFEMDKEARYSIIPLKEGAARVYGKDPRVLSAAANVGHITVGCQSFFPPEEDKDAYQWNIVVTGDSGRVLEAVVDLSKFDSKRIVILETTLSQEGVNRILLDNLPRLLPFGNSNGVLYKRIGPGEAVAAAKLQFSQALTKI